MPLSPRRGLGAACTATLVFATACTGGARSPGLGAQDATTAWGEQLLGVPPAFHAVGRRHPAWKEQPDRKDPPNAGASLTPRCKLELPVLQEPRLSRARREASTVEELVWKRGNELDLVAVLHHVPRGLDPRDPAQGPTAWRFEGVAPSGAAAFRVEGRPADGRLFVLPGDVWVLAVGPGRDRVGQAIAARPPPAESPRFPAAVTFAEVDGELFRACGTEAPVLNDPSLASVRLVLDADPEASRRVSMMTFAYTSTSAAASAAKELTKATAGSGLAAMLLPVRVVQDGSTVSVEMGFAPMP